MIGFGAGSFVKCVEVIDIHNSQSLSRRDLL
jgi:hypothetical protein